MCVCVCVCVRAYYSVTVFDPAWRGTSNMLYKQHSLPLSLAISSVFSFSLCYFLFFFASSCLLSSRRSITPGLPLHKAILHPHTVYFDRCVCVCVCVCVCERMCVCAHWPWMSLRTCMPNIYISSQGQLSFRDLGMELRLNSLLVFRLLNKVRLCRRGSISSFE